MEVNNMESTLDKIIARVEEIKRLNHSSASALMIIRDNRVVLEHYSGRHGHSMESLEVTAESRFNVASARKSYLALVIAWALYEGRIKSLDDKVVEYIDNIEPQLLGKTTLRHLVTHTHGLHENKEGTIFREFEAGTSWAYRGINVSMMIDIIEKIYHMSFVDVLKERVFQHFPLTETDWEAKDDPKLARIIDGDKETIKLGSQDGRDSNLYVSTREFAAWGLLHLNRGMVDGRQIVPQEVIQLAIQLQSPILQDQNLPKNGIFWYVQDTPSSRSEIGDRVPEGSYQILGVNGPTLLVIPEYNVVVAKMYNKRYNYGGDYYLYYLREFSNLMADAFSK